METFGLLGFTSAGVAIADVKKLKAELAALRAEVERLGERMGETRSP